ncbi:hypothetical protein [Nocardia brasiliensis]|uniref:hypothetical protein n=1 Tax=Nocardia brasiliensis TaxID=37326 RepID=UPI00245768EB|nr:hypothetical protein [Nocardia brasiliensis]
MGAEERLADLGMTFEETDFEGEVDSEVQGCLLIRRFDHGLRVKIAVAAGLAGEAREAFAEWAESRILRFTEHGPEPDGWSERTDGDWQLWARWQQMPLID